MTAIIIVYFLCATILFAYGINAHLLVALFTTHYSNLKSQKFDIFTLQKPIDYLKSGNIPCVTTQLPIYNEMNVVERIIDAVASFEYFEGRHEIQVLDDSSDETRDIVVRKVQSLRRKGVDIHHIPRKKRDGFKAGALRNGLNKARGDYIAIFDADFIPPSNFLIHTIPLFVEEPELGFVQARWGHLNENESWLTRLQAIGINGHFMVEQGARSTSGLFMNFNGTAGVFRKQAILDAGNWEGDTLTEDMDLSYRIQLKGWQCRYLIDLVAPAEIPGDLNAFKSQQFRWAKGSTQTAIKLLPRIWRSQASGFAKFQAFMHMTHYLIHPLMLTLAVLAPFLLMQEVRFLSGAGLLCFGMLLLASCTGPSRMYLVAERALGRPYLKTLLMLPLMICFGCGLAVNNSRAVIEALIGRSGAFVRTPKSGSRIRKRYHVSKNPLVYLELFTGLWCLYGMGLYFHSQHYLIGHFMLIYAVGFLGIGGFSWRHARRGTG